MNNNNIEEKVSEIILYNETMKTEEKKNENFQRLSKVEKKQLKILKRKSQHIYKQKEYKEKKRLKQLETMNNEQKNKTNEENNEEGEEGDNKENFSSSLSTNSHLKVKDLKEIQKRNLQQSLQSGLNVCIDLSFFYEKFNEDHSEFKHPHDVKELHSLSKQLALSYSVLKKASMAHLNKNKFIKKSEEENENIHEINNEGKEIEIENDWLFDTGKSSRDLIHLHITSFPSSSSSLLYQSIIKQGCLQWSVTLDPLAPWNSQSFSTSQLILLSPDAEEALEKIEQDKVIIYYKIYYKFIFYYIILYLCNIFIGIYNWRNC